MRILLLEDDTVLADIISTYLKTKDHQVILAKDGEKAIQLVDSMQFDLGILDINVPKINGLEVLRDIREYNRVLPVIIITAYQDTEHLKEAFELGCDDYIKKPFDLEELEERIRNVRKKNDMYDVIKVTEHISIEPSKNRLIFHRLDDKTEQISKREAQILLYFVKNRDKVISFEELSQNLWGDHRDIPRDVTFRVYIKNLRRLIGHESIKNIRGLGYIFE